MNYIQRILKLKKEYEIRNEMFFNCSCTIIEHILGFNDERNECVISRVNTKRELVESLSNVPILGNNIYELFIK